MNGVGGPSSATGPIETMGAGSRVANDGEASKHSAESHQRPETQTDTDNDGRGGYPTQHTQMSSQDFCALKAQVAQPVGSSAEVDLHELLKWLMAVKLLNEVSGGDK